MLRFFETLSKRNLVSRNEPKRMKRNVILISSLLFSYTVLLPPLSTDGIDINVLDLNMPWGNEAPSVRLSAWDFAGNYHWYSSLKMI